MSVEFDMSEVKALADTLGRAGTKADTASRVHVKAAGAWLASTSKADVAVRSGETRDSIRVEDEGDDVIVMADSDAAFYLEFGTGDTAPQPFLWPHVPATVKRLVKALDEVIDPFDK